MILEDQRLALDAANVPPLDRLLLRQLLDHRHLTAQVLHDEQEKRGDHECLVAIAQQRQVLCRADKLEGKPRDGGVHGDHQLDADNVALQGGLVVVRKVAVDANDGDDDGDEGERKGDPAEGLHQSFARRHSFAYQKRGKKEKEARLVGSGRPQKQKTGWNCWKSPGQRRVRIARPITRGPRQH